ncbi:MAG TPA: ParA family protein [Caldimonas sp.]|nr:ParA family protein [Caldimonas sp.]
MPVIAVVNRKGGSGKSTLATHLAAWCAHAGIPVMLGDVDRQQSTQSWLRLREAQGLPPAKAQLVGWAVDPKRVMRPPAGVNHVVLDTPGGLHGFDLARVAMCADAILMPVCNSVFDRQSSAECHAELMTLPRIASGRCRVAAVGMRLDARTRAAEVLSAWAADRGIPFIGSLRETQAYVKCVEQGLTIFDLPAAQTQADRAQWQSILEWLEPVLHMAPRTAVRGGETRRVIDAMGTRTATAAAPAPAGVADAALPPVAAPEMRPVAVPIETQAKDPMPRPSIAPDPVVATAPMLRVPSAAAEANVAPSAAFGAKPASARASILGWLPLPRFLQKHA